MKKRNWWQIIKYRLWLYHDEKITFRDLIPKRITKKQIDEYAKWLDKFDVNKDLDRIVYCEYCREVGAAGKGIDIDDLMECYVCKRNTKVKYR